MFLHDFDYYLPKELIAQYPHQKRDEARLLVYKNNSIRHKLFYNIIDYLEKDDILVLNNTKVLSARLFGKKETTGADIEIFVTKKLTTNNWECLLRPLKRLKEGTKIFLTDDIIATVLRKDPMEEKNIIQFNKKLNFSDLDKIGYTPLPPYIKRNYKHYSSDLAQKDKQYYQTTFAKKYGSVASPTAGLHFTDDLLEKIEKKGILLAYITLDISLGTFKPVQEEKIENHIIHSETFFLPQETADLINNRKGRVISVGTTSTRVLETVAKINPTLTEYKGETQLYIYPPYQFKIIDALITNFHLPKSTLLMLVSAFAGLENIKKIYTEAVQKKYLFFSFGDAMYLEKNRTHL